MVNPRFPWPRPALAAMLIVACFAGGAGGCGGYSISGRVVQGEGSVIAFVSAEDARLSDAGVGSAKIRLRRDPQRLSGHDAATGFSDREGWFEIPVGEFGAGWMEEVWLIRAERESFAPAEMIMPLPASTSGRKLLIVLTPLPTGAAPVRNRDEDYMKDYERFR